MAYICIFWGLKFQFFLFWIVKFAKKANFDGLYKHFLEARINKFPFLDILFPFMEVFDGLYKHSLEAKF
jgi:hypothetical protein